MRLVPVVCFFHCKVFAELLTAEMCIRTHCQNKWLAKSKTETFRGNGQARSRVPIL